VSRTTYERLADARQFAAEARKIVAGMDADIFEMIEYYHYAVRYCLLAVGEALRHVPQEVQDSAPEIAWRPIINMRHRLAHDYWLIDTEIVLEAALQHAEPLIGALDRLMVRSAGSE
jgi:uncharacterized protein with HEPN domain